MLTISPSAPRIHAGSVRKAPARPTNPARKGAWRAVVGHHLQVVACEVDGQTASEHPNQEYGEQTPHQLADGAPDPTANARPAPSSSRTCLRSSSRSSSLRSARICSRSI